MTRLITFFALISLVVGCTADKGDIEVPGFEGCDTTSSVTYTNFVSGLIQTTCSYSGCHNAGSINDYSTYAGIKQKVDGGMFQVRVLNLKDMPSLASPGRTSLTACELAKLRQWVNAGAPE